MIPVDPWQLARRALNRALVLGTAPIRAVLGEVVRRRPEQAGRIAEWSWVWQPGWGRSWHEDHYAVHDPQGYSTNPYERQKYADMMEVIGERRFARALEIGSAEGVFTAQLAPHCDELLGIDISERAVSRARQALADRPHVRFERRTLPFDWPQGSHDLIVCSDVLYLWPPAVLDRGLRRLRESLAPGGLLLLQHYLGDFGQPVHGDRVVARLTSPAVGGPPLRGVGTRVRSGIGPTSATEGPGFRIDWWTTQDIPPAAGPPSRAPAG